MIARRFRSVAVPLAVGLIGLGLSACSSNTTSDAATITYRDGSGSHTIHISRTNYKSELADLVGSKQFLDLVKAGNFGLTGDQKNSTSASLSAAYLGQLVDQAAADAEFAALKLTISPEVRTAAVTQAKRDFALANEFGPADAQGRQQFIGPGAVYASFPKSLQNTLVDRDARQLALQDYYAGQNLTAAKAQALYDQFASNICSSGRVASHILVKTEAAAKTILEQLRNGASFADLARTKSTDKTSAATGGSVGCVRPGSFVKEFETAALAAPFGVPTGPVKTQFGYHVILVSHASFAALSSELTKAVQQNPFVARDLRLQSMKVWINPQFGTGALAVDSQRQALVYQVKPPVVPSPRSVRETTTTAAATTTTVPAGG
jgi:hypothetical protein